MKQENNTLWLGTQKEKQFALPLQNLKKHAIALGSSGSGKTVFTKILIEDAALQKIPSLVFDVQGDLCSLALFGTKKEREEHKLDEEEFTQLKEQTEVTIYTPVSSKGISICINPLDLPKTKIPEEEAITLIHDTATALTKLLGASLNTSKGKYAQAVLYSTLFHSHKTGKSINTFRALIDLLRHPSEELQEEIAEFLAEKKSLDYLIKQLKYLTIGQKKLLFQFGVPSDINLFFAKNNQAQKKTPISIIYLNSLGTQEEKEYFVARIANQLYQWMLDNPSEKIQGIFALDEIAPFLPAGSEKPVCKPMLKLLFKQARKYGIACIIATQNPGDIDYKAFSQFGTWAIGRLNLKQDIKKVKQALKSLTEDINLEATLPKLQTGNFLLYAPDSFDKLQQFNTRWLYTQHKTLTETAVKKLMDARQREYDPLRVQKEETQAQSPKERATKITQEEIEPSIPIQKILKKAAPLKVMQVQGVSGNEMRTFALKERKKRFNIFGEFTSQLLNLQKSERVMYIASIRQVKNSLGGLLKNTKDYDLVFDATSGKIISITEGKRKAFLESEKITTLPQTELRLAKEVHLMKETYRSEEELQESTRLAKQTITKNLKSLEKKNVIAHEVVGKFNRWFGSTQFKENKLQKLSSDLILENTLLKAPKTRVSEEHIRTFVRTWFENASITQLHILLIPEYLATYSKEKDTTTILFDGINMQKISGE